MNVIHVSHDLARHAGKSVGRKAPEAIGCSNAAVNIGHAVLDVLAEHELTAAFGNFDHAKFPGPIIHVLKKMAVNRLKVRKIKIAVRNALGRAGGKHAALKGV